MVVLGLKRFCKKNNLFQREPLENLSGARLCVDGPLWLKKIAPRFDEPWSSAMGGVPLSAKGILAEEIKRFQNCNIHPVFVFNGINLHQIQPSGRLEAGWVHQQGIDHYIKREDAWRDYPSQPAVARMKFADASANSLVGSGDFLAMLLQYFRDNNIEYFRAPYLGWAQSAWFCGERETFAHWVWGSEETLLFLPMVKMDRLITEIDFDKQEFEFLVGHDIRTRLGLQTATQFIDCCIIVGFKNSQLKSLSTTNAEGKQETKVIEGLGSLEAVASKLMATEHKQGSHLLDSEAKKWSRPEEVQQLWDLYMRLKNLIHHHVIFTLQGVALPLSYHTGGCQGDPRNPYKNSTPPARDPVFPCVTVLPKDLHSIIGPRLPDEVYFFLSVGLLSPQVVNNVVHNFMVEYTPAIDSVEYRSLLQKIVPLRTQVAYLLIFALISKDSSFWRTKNMGGSRAPMNCIQWHNELPMPLHTPPELSLDDWQMVRNMMNPTETISFKSVLKFANFAMKTSSSNQNTNNTQKFTSYPEVMNNVLLKILDLLGYFTHPQGQRPWGNEYSGMSLFAETLNNCVSPAMSERGVLFVELLRTGALDGNPMTPPRPSSIRPANDTSNHTIPISDDNCDSRARLIARVFSIIPGKLKDKGWESQRVNRDLCAFNVLVKSLYRTLRNLAEIVAVLLFLDGKVDVEGEDKLLSLVTQLSTSLPFQEHISTAVGIVISYVLAVFQSGRLDHIEDPREAWEFLQLEQEFPNFINLREDLRSAIKFWGEAFACSTKLAEANVIMPDLIDNFRQADGLLMAVAKKLNLL